MCAEVPPLEEGDGKECITENKVFLTLCLMIKQFVGRATRLHDKQQSVGSYVNIASKSFPNMFFVICDADVCYLMCVKVGRLHLCSYYRPGLIRLYLIDVLLLFLFCLFLFIQDPEEVRFCP